MRLYFSSKLKRNLFPILTISITMIFVLYFLLSNGGAQNLGEIVMRLRWEWLALAIVVLTAAGVFLYLWRSRSVDSERYWLTESTGRIHKEGCMYYQKTKGFFVTGRKNYRLCRKCFGIEGKSGKK